jgi:hypothetical protein
VGRAHGRGCRPGARPPSTTRSRVPLTEHLARSLGEHRVIERIADELIAKGTVTALFDQALQAGLAEQIADRLLAPDVLDSPVLLEITDRVMASDEMQRVIAHIASSPELRAAIAEQRPPAWRTRWSPACASARSRWTTSRSARCAAGCAGRAR